MALTLPVFSVTFGAGKKRTLVATLLILLISTSESFHCLLQDRDNVLEATGVRLS